MGECYSMYGFYLILIKVSDSNGEEVDYYDLFVRICSSLFWKILELSWFYSEHHYIVNQKDFVRDLLSFASLTILLEIITAIFCMINTSKKYKISMASFIIFGFLEELYWFW